MLTTTARDRSRGGRPALPPEQRRSERIETRVSPIERQRLDAALAASGTTEADWARRVLLAAAEAELEVAGTKAA